jgi:glycosyltransferase involved in cell wall biosynthesis
VPVFGRKGNSVHVQEVIRALQRRGASVELFASRFGGDAPSDLEGVRVHPLPEIPKMDAQQREQAAFASNESLHQALENSGSFDLIYERYSLLIEEQLEHRGLYDEALARRVAATVFRDASALLAVSAEVGLYLEAQQPDACHKIHVIPNGVNPSRFPLHVMPSISKALDSFTLGFVGTLKPWHGLSVLVDAFTVFSRRNPAARLLIVGDGPERSWLETTLEERGLLEVTHLTGAVDPSDVPGLMVAMDVAVAPYPALEHFYFSPLKIVEYMASGRAVVASRIGQIPELIEHDRTGLLVEPGNVEALIAALERLQLDFGLRQRLGHAARDFVLEYHTWDAVVNRFLALVKSDYRPQPVVLASSVKEF